jgi:hypothetical protein
VPGGNYSAAVGIDRVSGRQLWALHGHFEHDQYAGLLCEIAAVYGGMLVVERNNHGHAVILGVQKYLASHPDLGGRFRLMAGLDGRPGWVTNGATRPAMIGSVAEALRDAAIALRDKALLTELQDHRVLDTGSTGPSEGRHDDRVLALALSLVPGRLRVPPRAPSAGAAGFDTLSPTR